MKVIKLLSMFVKFHVNSSSLSKAKYEGDFTPSPLYVRGNRVKPFCLHCSHKKTFKIQVRRN